MYEIKIKTAIKLNIATKICQFVANIARFLFFSCKQFYRQLKIFKKYI